MGGRRQPRSPDYLCIGEFLWDRFGTGATLGGAPSNVAFHLAQLGVRVGLISRVGDDDDGHRAIAELARAGVDTRLVQIDRERPTGLVDVVVENGEPRYRLHAGRAWERIECTAQVRTAIGRARGVCFGTLAQRTEFGERAHRDMLRRVPETAVAMCDVNFRRGFDDWPAVERSLTDASAIKINDGELASIRSQFGTASVAALAQRFAIRDIALTHGADGATLWSSGRATTVPGIAASPGGDNVGCGDAFSAVMLVGLARATPARELLTVANEYAGFVACHRGATPVPPARLVSRVQSSIARR